MLAKEEDLAEFSDWAEAREEPPCIYLEPNGPDIQRPPLGAQPMSLTPSGFSMTPTSPQSGGYPAYPPSAFPGQTFLPMQPPGVLVPPDPTQLQPQHPMHYQVPELPFSGLSASASTPDMMKFASSGSASLSSVTSGIAPPYGFCPPEHMPVSVPHSMVYTMQHPVPYHMPHSFPYVAMGHSNGLYHFSCPNQSFTVDTLQGQVFIPQPAQAHAQPSPQMLGPVQYAVLPQAAGSPVNTLPMVPIHAVPAVPLSVTIAGDAAQTPPNSVGVSAAAAAAAATSSTRRQNPRDHLTFRHHDRSAAVSNSGEPLEITSREAAEERKAEIKRKGAQAAIAYIQNNEQYIESLIQSAFANRLLQFLVELSPDVVGNAIIDNITFNEDTFRTIIKGKYSCWVLQAILTQEYTHNQVFEDLLVKHSLEFARNESGNFVLQRALKCPQFHSFDALATNLLKDFQSICDCKYGSRVAEFLVTMLRDQSRLEKAAFWLFTRPYFFDLVISQHGCFVVEKIAELTTGDVQMCCLRMIKHVINAYALPSQAARACGLSQDQLKRTQDILHSVRLKCKLLNRGFDSLVPMSQEGLTEFLAERGIVATDPL